MARKISLELTVKLTVNLEEGEKLDDLISELNYDFSYSPDNAENRIVDSEIENYEVIDSK